MGKMQRTKGAAGEREFCKIFSEMIGVELARNLMQTRNGGEGGDTTPLGPWAIEIKRAATPRIKDWWKQAVEQATNERIPVLAYRIDRHDWRIFLPIRVLNSDNDLWIGCSDARMEWGAEISLHAFAAIVREQVAYAS